MKLPKLTFWRAAAILIALAGLVVTFVRFTKGIGAVTNLNDTYPWGLWIGFDVLCGVGLAAGGFTVTAIVYLFNLKKFHEIARPAVLTAFLGYILVAVALMYDLGKPWNIWHPIIYWNERSVMFEVGWCVMLYLTVLALEFSPVVWEKLGWRRPQAIIKALQIPLVIAGVVLSTLHQSSLGSLFLIAPERLHPLWWTPRLPLLFYISAIGIGFAMVIFESRLSSRAFGRELEMPILSQLGKGIVIPFMVYLVLRMEDLYARGVLQEYAFQPTLESRMFWAEILLGFLLPVLLLLSPAVRNSKRWLPFAATIAVLGFMFNRLNVSITAIQARTPDFRYFPSLGELVVSALLVVIGFTAFAVAVKYFNVFPPAAEQDERIVVGAGMPAWWEPAPAAGSAAGVGSYTRYEGLPPAGSDGPRGVPH
jgi:Ni/Fe-hydrogenase subunit HybB-like protein